MSIYFNKSTCPCKAVPEQESQQRCYQTEYLREPLNLVEEQAPYNEKPGKQSSPIRSNSVHNLFKKVLQNHHSLDMIDIYNIIIRSKQTTNAY